MERLRPNDQRAKAAITLIWVVMVLDIVSLISGYYQYELLQSAANGEVISMATANANDTREQIIGVLYLIAFAVSAITFIQWFRRAYFNLHLKVNHLSQTEGWAAGSWFVPIIALYRPYQIMKELYEETVKVLTKKNVPISENITTGLLGLWWGLWVINNLLGQFVFRYSMNAESIDELIVTTVSGMISNVIGIPLALITVKVISDYAKVEPLLFQINEEEPPTPEVVPL